MLLLPMPGFIPALKPKAVFELPSLLLESAPAPTAVLLLATPFPVESLLARATSPMAVLPEAWILLKSALSPRALLLNRSEEHTSELQSHSDLVCRLLLEK